MQCSVNFDFFIGQASLPGFEPSRISLIQNGLTVAPVCLGFERPVHSTVQYGHFFRSMHQAGGSRSRKAFLRCIQR